MGKTPPPPDEENEEELANTLPRDKQMAQDVVDGLAHPEEDVFPDEEMMDDTEVPNEEDMETICFRCYNIIQFCTCDPD